MRRIAFKNVKYVLQSMMKICQCDSSVTALAGANHHLIKFFPRFVGGREWSAIRTERLLYGAVIFIAIKSTRLVEIANRLKGIFAFPVLPYVNLEMTRMPVIIKKKIFDRLFLFGQLRVRFTLCGRTTMLRLGF